MRSTGLAFALAALPAAAFGQSDGHQGYGFGSPMPGELRAASSGEPPASLTGGASGVGPWTSPERPLVVTREQVFLPATPEYVAARTERLERAWQELSEKLNRPVSANTPQITPPDAVREIAAQIDAPLRIDHAAMTDEGINVEEPVALDAQGVSAESAFLSLLEPLELTAVIDGETLVVTTQTVAEEMHLTRVYPVPDLIVTIDDGTLRADFNPLIDMIQQTTPGHWFVIDGVGGTLAPHRTGGVLALVVRQNYANHREIEALLARLRQARPEAVRDALLRPAEGTSDLSPRGTRQAIADNDPERAELVERLRRALREAAAHSAGGAARVDRGDSITVEPTLPSDSTAPAESLVVPASPKRETTVVVPIGKDGRIDRSRRIIPLVEPQDK